MNGLSMQQNASKDWNWPQSLWFATATPEPKTEALSGTRDVDAIVIGAGFTGLRAALVLAEAGRSVAVVDARSIGWGASGRNGGQVNPLPHTTPEEMAAIVGPERMPQVAQTVLNSAQETFDLIAHHSIECEARQTGWLRVDHCDKAKEKARASAESWRRQGAEIEFLEAEETAAATGTQGYKSATLMRSGGAVQPLSYARGLARVALAAGVSIYSSTPATSLKQSAGKWEVTTPQGLLRAGSVLLCTNGYTDRLWPGLAESVVPLVSMQAATVPLSGATYDEILPGGRTLADTRRTIIYGRREPDGRILMGSLGSIAKRGEETAFAHMRRAVEQLYPQLKGVRWEYHWSGRIAITRDHLPHLHEPAPGLLAGLGYNGRGVALSTVMGRILAERVLGKAEDALPFPTTAIKGYPLHRFHQLGAEVVARWMRFQDRMEMR